MKHNSMKTNSLSTNGSNAMATLHHIHYGFNLQGTLLNGNDRREISKVSKKVRNSLGFQQGG